MRMSTIPPLIAIMMIFVVITCGPVAADVVDLSRFRRDTTCYSPGRMHGRVQGGWIRWGDLANLLIVFATDKKCETVAHMKLKMI
ncbi:hypothetical protein MTO96_041910 [Rhipicephalus appendiculatus]